MQAVLEIDRKRGQVKLLIPGLPEENLNFNLFHTTVQCQIFACSKSKSEILEKDAEYVQS